MLSHITPFTPVKPNQPVEEQKMTPQRYDCFSDKLSKLSRHEQHNFPQVYPIGKKTLYKMTTQPVNIYKFLPISGHDVPKKFL